jgi:hypothetical protein
MKDKSVKVAVNTLHRFLVSRGAPIAWSSTIRLVKRAGIPLVWRDKKSYRALSLVDCEKVLRLFFARRGEAIQRRGFHSRKPTNGAALLAPLHREIARIRQAKRLRRESQERSKPVAE